MEQGTSTKRTSIEHQNKNFSDLRKSLENIAIAQDVEVQMKIQTFKSNLSSQLPEKNEEYNTTVLNLALSILSFHSEEEKNLLRWIIEMYPETVLHAKSGKKFKGQLPLHMAICHGDILLVNLLLDPLSPKDKKFCLCQKATGREFASTVMAAEVPLSVAALTGKKEMIDHLLRYGAKPTKKNSKGENVLHSIISYTYHYPEKADLMVEMMTFIMEKSTAMNELEKQNPCKRFRLRLLIGENNNGWNPLQAALQLGQLEIFKYILQKAYMHTHGHGLFDVKEYDMTDVDKSLTLVSNESTSKARGGKNETFPLDHLFFLNTKTSIAFLNYIPLSRLIRQKWLAYRSIFYTTFCVHFVIMIMLTVTAILRAERKPVGGVKSSAEDLHDYVFSFQTEVVGDQFVITTGFISLVLAIFYIFQEIVRFSKGRLPWQRKHFFSNSNNMFRLLIIIFALSLIADFIVTWFPVSGDCDCVDIPLLLAILTGWFFLLFFLRAKRFFCQFTSLVQRAMFEILKFSVIIMIELVAFTTVMYVLIRGSKVDADDNGKEFQQHWLKALFLVFQQIFGIGELPQSNIRNRVFVNIVYIFFIVMTSVLMLNALIAIMSNMCTDLFNSNDVTAYLRLQQFSIIRFFESILPDRMAMKKARKDMKLSEKFRYNPNTKKLEKMVRFVLPMESLRSISINSIAISPDSAEIQQSNNTNMMGKPKEDELPNASNSILGSISAIIFPDIRSRRMTKSDSIEIHHLRLGLCDRCHQQYVLPRSKLNKIVPFD
ncbi:hypothetical protein CHS0354_030634 [Potamilus streckersoni]|uniref:Ion transport domain-containing protein n=1 Tax=Potamilus streckersoni TaxID=2493646 RepID=A0AAE0SML5_9BIVA|nr:hypothetical protein CHS0354_030634 [Potamilus streckersoni]